MDKTRRELMAARDAAVKAGDWAKMNHLTKQIADLPLAGVSKLTQKDIEKYNRKR